MKTKMDYIQEMKQGDILKERELTFTEYANQLTAFQDIVCKMIAEDAYHDGMRFDEATFIMESEARRKGIRNEAAIHNGVQTMKKLTKEMAITMSGINGERLVSKTLDYMSRPKTQVFRNVYVSDGQKQTELDAVVLTDEGLIILEVKKVKSDLTLTEDGRMVFADNECYDDIPLCEKMVLKRKLLKKHIESQLSAKGLNIPVFVDSYIVFSAPKGQFIYIDDRYHREKHCFRTGLNKVIENYLGCAYYGEKELEEIGEIISAMESNVKRFETKLNFDEIRLSLAEAMVLLQDDKTLEKTSEPAETEKISYTEQKGKTVKTSKNAIKSRKNDRFAYFAASLLAGVAVLGLAAMTSTKSHKS